VLHPASNTPAKMNVSIGFMNFSLRILLTTLKISSACSTRSYRQETREYRIIWVGLGLGYPQRIHQGFNPSILLGNVSALLRVSGEVVLVQS
ncbi:MAG: hypothetical protein ACK55I_44700, partial [bacterium]